MDRIDLDGRSHVEASLLETQAHTSCSRKQVDADWTHCP
jgi:hypothetical protein